MIKNEKQYRITSKKLLTITEAMDQLQSRGETLPAKERLLLVSLMTMQEQLKSEINAYNELKTSTSPILSERSIDNLSDLLIEFKIRSGMTQKEFAEKIGMKEQQLQRYEAENFSGISFKNLLKILHAIGLDVSIKGTMPGASLQKQIESNQDQHLPATFSYRKNIRGRKRRQGGPAGRVSYWRVPHRHRCIVNRCARKRKNEYLHKK